MKTLSVPPLCFTGGKKPDVPAPLDLAAEMSQMIAGQPYTGLRPQMPSIRTMLEGRGSSNAVRFGAENSTRAQGPADLVQPFRDKFLVNVNLSVGPDDTFVALCETPEGGRKSRQREFDTREEALAAAEDVFSRSVPQTLF